MSQVPDSLLYTKDHEWIRLEGDDVAVVGITDYAQESLGDITFVEFPETGKSVCSGDVFGVVESVKAASDLFMPVDAEILEINKDVDAEPELLNRDSYGKGWLLKIRLADPGQLETLLKAESYSRLM